MARQIFPRKRAPNPAIFSITQIKPTVPGSARPSRQVLDMRARARKLFQGASARAEQFFPPESLSIFPGRRRFSGVAVDFLRVDFPQVAVDFPKPPSIFPRRRPSRLPGSLSIFPQRC